MQFEILKDTIIYHNIQDFDLSQTFLCGQTFRFDRCENGFKGFICKQLCFITQDVGSVYVKVYNLPVDKQLAIDIGHFLSLDIDYTALKSLFKQDETLKKAINYAEGIRVLNQDFFETLISFIISQNNNIPRIKGLCDTLAKKYGSKVLDSFAFPTAQQLRCVTVQDYSDMKFGFRAKYLFDAVQKIANGEINEKALKQMPYQEAQKYLMQIKGVGPKVADCVLLFSCEKYESFPKDVWISRAMQVMFPDGLPCICKGYEGIAQQYIFHYARFNIK